jgi:hypothetical protein
MLARALRRTRVGRLGSASIALALSVACSSPALAGPQGTVGLTIGAAGVSPGSEKIVPLAEPPRGYWAQTDFHLGLRADLMFLRAKNSDFGIGPYAELLTHAFDEVQFGGGATVLLPVLDNLPVVVSGGAYARKGDDRFGLTPGVAATLFWGSRSYNFHSPYVLAAGLLGEFRYGLGPNRETSIVLGAQIDLEVLALPFVFLASAARGHSHEADPIR